MNICVDLLLLMCYLLSPVFSQPLGFYPFMTSGCLCSLWVGVWASGPQPHHLLCVPPSNSQRERGTYVSFISTQYLTTQWHEFPLWLNYMPGLPLCPACQPCALGFPASPWYRQSGHFSIYKRPLNIFFKKGII